MKFANLTKLSEFYKRLLSKVRWEHASRDSRILRDRNEKRMRLSVFNQRRGQHQNHCSFTMHEGFYNDDLTSSLNRRLSDKLEKIRSPKAIRDCKVVA